MASHIIKGRIFFILFIPIISLILLLTISFSYFSMNHLSEQMTKSLLTYSARESSIRIQNMINKYISYVNTVERSPELISISKVDWKNQDESSVQSDFEADQLNKLFVAIDRRASS